MDGNVLTATNCNLEAANSEFTNATVDVVVLNGGKYSFTHCTLANYISAKAGIRNLKKVKPVIPYNYLTIIQIQIKRSCHMIYYKPISTIV